MSEMPTPIETTPRRHPGLWPRWVWLVVAPVVLGAVVAVGIWLMGEPTPTPTAGTQPPAADTPAPSPTSSATTTAEPTESPTPLPGAAAEPTAPEGWQVHPDAPFGLGGTVAWTGDELVVGAGACCAALDPPELAAYDPVTGTWRSLPDHPVRCRGGDAAVWTGDELIFVGGFTTPDCVMSGTNDPGDDLDSYALDVQAGTWQMLPRPPRTLRTVDHLAWTGSEVLGLGRTGFDPGGSVLLLRYDPVTDAWAAAPSLPGPARRDFAAVWAGDRLLVWSGSYQRSPWPDEEWRLLADGWAYTPGTDTWTPIAPAPMPGQCRPYATWTGTEMVIWGGTSTPVLDDTSTRGAAYDPATDTWRDLPYLPAGALPDLLSSPNPWWSVWTETEFIVWIEGITDNEWTTVGIAYDPDVDTWRVLPPTPMYKAVSATWTGHSVLLTGSLVDDVHGGPPGQRLVEYHPGPGTGERGLGGGP